MKYLLSLGLLGLARGTCENFSIDACDSNDCIWGIFQNTQKCYTLNRIKYYCANGSKEYAEMLGGILCPESPGVTPECPNNKPCVCIGASEYENCVDWGYELETPQTCSDYNSYVFCTYDGCDWGSSGAEGACYHPNDITYYCSNDGKIYAEGKGGILCGGGHGVTPKCPNEEPCLCIDEDGDCDDGDDDWGYVDQSPESSASQLSLFMPLATVAVACLSGV